MIWLMPEDAFPFSGFDIYFVFFFSSLSYNVFYILISSGTKKKRVCTRPVQTLQSNTAPSHRISNSNSENASISCADIRTPASRPSALHPAISYHRCT
ncbi:hypothetical protein I7I48_09759 [Histoplasma ohiense]|nr:hypothetical protein I7I48_09759 [Histoplasma ohiense (nom. inval.)]